MYNVFMHLIWAVTFLNAVAGDKKYLPSSVRKKVNIILISTVVQRKELRLSGAPSKKTFKTLLKK